MSAGETVSSTAQARPLHVAVAAAEGTGAQVVRRLVERHRVHLVLASPSTEPSQGPAEVAAENDIPVRAPELVTQPDFAETLRASGIDLLLNVHSLYIVHTDVLATPRLGAFNLHPGPLPEYAGLSCPSWAIYNGATEYGVTVHRMTETIDAGDIAYAARFAIRADDTGGTLSARCARAGVPLLLGLVDDACAGGAIPGLAQDLTRRRYYAQAGPEPRLDWSLPAHRVVGHIRAADYSPFGSPWADPLAFLDRREIAVVKAAASGESADGVAPGTIELRDGVVRVAAADEWVVVRRVKVDGAVVPPASVLPHGRVLTSA